MSGFAKMMGVDVQKALQEAKGLSSGSPVMVESMPPTTGQDPLSSLKSGLKRK